MSRPAQQLAGKVLGEVMDLGDIQAEGNALPEDPNYQIIPQSPVGAVLRGLDLKKQLPDEIIKRLIADVLQYKVIVAKDQGAMNSEEQLRVTGWFGEIETAGFEVHAKSPDRAILRVSNDLEEGFMEFGTSGFHIDGSSMRIPNTYSLYHIISAPDKGCTCFASLSDVLDSLSEKQRLRWDRLWGMKSTKCVRGHTDIPGYEGHPLVYAHPVSGVKTMCFHLGKTERFIWDKGSPSERDTDREETKEILKEIYDAIHRDDGRHIYYHKWEPGDFILSDNLAVCHYATPETQMSRDQVGLRVMHRTIVKGYSHR